MSDEDTDNNNEFNNLILHSRKAQPKIAGYSQTQVVQLTNVIAWALVRKNWARNPAQLADNEGGFGNFQDKPAKIRNRILGALADMQQLITVGVFEEILEKRLIKITRLVGIIAAQILTTGPDAMPPLKALLTVKGRSPIFAAAHSQIDNSTALTIPIIQEACKNAGAPQDLFQLKKKSCLSQAQELAGW